MLMCVMLCLFGYDWVFVVVVMVDDDDIMKVIVIDGEWGMKWWVVEEVMREEDKLETSRVDFAAFEAAFEEEWVCRKCVENELMSLKVMYR